MAVRYDASADPYESVTRLLAGTVAPRTAGSYAAPGAPSAPAPISTTPPQPAASSTDQAARMLAQPPAQTQGSLSSVTNPQTTTTQGSLTGAIQNSGIKTGGKLDDYWSGVWQGIKGTPDEQALTDYIHYVQSWPVFKGSFEAQRMAIANYARQLREARKDSAIDYGGLAKLGDENRSLADQLSAILAARGASPSGGVSAGALSQLNANTGANVADYISEQNAAKRKEQLALRLAQMEQDQQWMRYFMDQKIREENDGGFFDDFLGAVGGALPVVAGAVL